MAFLQKEKCGSDSTCKVAAGYCYTSSIKVHLPSYKQTLLNICKNTLHGFPPGEMWLLNVVPKCGSDSTCKVAAGCTTGRKPLYLVVTGHMLEGQRS